VQRALQRRPGMKNFSSLFIIPFSLIILLSIFSGFSSGNGDVSPVKELIKERTNIMQKMLLSQINLEKAEELLYEIETQPLLSSDIRSLRDYKDTDMDVVREMEVLALNPVSDIYGYKSFTGDVLWYMRGPDGDYVQSIDYNIVIKKTGKKYKISEFSPLIQ
jgi:hypothetical protein